MMIENLFLFGFLGAALALGFAFLQSRRVLLSDEGNDIMKKIAAAIRTGAKAYMKRQYRLVGKFFAIMFFILLGLAYLPPLFGANALVNGFVPFAFLTGGFFTTLAGFLGMTVATNANARTTNAAKESLNKGLKVSFAAGSVMGFVVTGFMMFNITMWFCILKFGFGLESTYIAQSMIMFGMGGACAAMFARVGGGIFTKAADVGADLVGKVEAGIPEDDPRNPAVIADNVGDNVGDVAGMGADLTESYSNAILATFALGAFAGFGYGGMLVPILVCVVGTLASIIGCFCVRTEEKATQKSLLRALTKGTLIAGLIAAVGAIPVIHFIASFDPGGALAANAWGIYATIVIGILCGIIVGYVSEYYTSDAYKPTRNLAKTTETGTATLMIGGISLGMKATAIPILVVSAGAIASFILSGGREFLASGDMTAISFSAGLYGIGLAAVGMLATLGFNLACDAFGPVADNAGGIAQMAKLPEHVRERTDALDSLGNTTAATGKGFAICSTAFTALALLVSYMQMAEELGANLNLAITNPPVLMGLFVGAATVFLFAALCISAVNNAAQSIVKEVRRQFREIVGLMEGTAEADYHTCVDICTRSAQKEMLAPSLLAFIAPLLVGFFFGASGVIGFLAGINTVGFAVAVFMLTAGGAWDNAKKYIEAGNFGGKGTENHKAAVAGDTVGDPLKDTAGPSFNLLITLSATVALVFVSVTLAFSLM